MNFNIIKASDDFYRLIKKDCFNIVVGGNEIINRKALENKNVQMLLNAEPKEDNFMHSKNSGLNQVLAKLAKKDNISIGFSFNKILSSNYEERIDLFGKIMQNIMICNKYKVKMYIVNFIKNEIDKRNINDLKDLGISLGMLPGKFEILEIKNE
jgi:ribonuclease P/MRP protein subunit RPP1